MASNVSPLAKYTVLVYNSNASVPASKQVADYYCQLRGIPIANQISFDMGTGATWAWRNDWHSAVLTPLYTKVMSVGAKAVLTVAGCPSKVALTADGGGSNLSVPLPTFLAAVKVLYGGGGEPRATGGYINTAIPRILSRRINTTCTGSKRAFSPPALLPAAQTAVAVGTAAGQPPTWVSHATLVDPSWMGEWDTHALLLKGLVGYSTWPDSTHPANLYDRSKAVIDRACANEFPIAQARAQKLLVGIYSTYPNATTTIQDALCVSVMKDNGFTNIVYWNGRGLGTAGTDCLAPAPETFGAATTADADAQIAAGYAPAQDPWLIFGIDFPNNVVNPLDVELADNWMAFLNLQNKGVCFVGASYGYQWARLLQNNGGIGGNGSPSDVAHISSAYIVRSASIFLALLGGMSLCEAELAQWEESYGDAGGVIGDPLMRPIIVGREIAPSQTVGGTIPTGLVLGATLTDVPAVSQHVSNVLTLSGFTGQVLCQVGAMAGNSLLYVNGVPQNYDYCWVSAGDTVQIQYVTPYLASYSAVVELRLNGVLSSSWSITTAASSLPPEIFSGNGGEGLNYVVTGSWFGGTPATCQLGNNNDFSSCTSLYTVPRASNTDTSFTSALWALDPPDLPPPDVSYVFITNSTTGLRNSVGLPVWVPPSACTGAFTNQPAVPIGATNLVSATSITYPRIGNMGPAKVEVLNANTEFRVDGGSWRSTPVGVLPGSTLGIRLLAASGANSTAEDAQIQVGAHTYTFTCTTIAG